MGRDQFFRQFFLQSHQRSVYPIVARQKASREGGSQEKGAAAHPRNRFIEPGEADERHQAIQEDQRRRDQ
ncbi:hypothetical protein D9M70_585020 [compost metagenome]